MSNFSHLFKNKHFCCLYELIQILDCYLNIVYLMYRMATVCLMSYVFFTASILALLLPKHHGEQRAEWFQWLIALSYSPVSWTEEDWWTRSRLFPQPTLLPVLTVAAQYHRPRWAKTHAHTHAQCPVIFVCLALKWLQPARHWLLCSEQVWRRV